MAPEPVLERYRELQAYVGWTAKDAARVRALAPLVLPSFDALIDDFYDEIQRHPAAAKVIVGGAEQIERLKKTLCLWLTELFSGVYDDHYVERRWRVGWRHVEVGLDQIYASMALSRLRQGLSKSILDRWAGSADERAAALRSLNTLLDLDSAIIVDAYHAELMHRLQHSERLATIGQVLQTAHAVVLILDLEGRIVQLNRYWEQLSGRQLAEVQGQDWVETLLAQRARPAMRELFYKALQGEPIQGYVGPIMTLEGRLLEIEWWATTMADLDGTASGLLCIGHDVTNLRIAQERAVRAERLAAIGQMVTGLAHESRNALQRMQACLEMLETEIEDRSEALGYVHRIQAAQDHLQQLFNEVRGYAAPIKLEREPSSLATVWRQAWTHLNVERQGRDARLVENDGTVDLRCEVDPFRLEQVFRNIFENSLAAAADPVRVEIACSSAPVDGNAGVKVSIRDNGPGMTPEQRSRIFEPFYTTKTSGTGLGMAIARRIVEAHGGEISAVDCRSGAEIVITVPRAAT
jgi:PAS domain S-box-containing protein